MRTGWITRGRRHARPREARAPGAGGDGLQKPMNFGRPPDDPDVRLMLRVRGGDQDGFAALFGKHAPAVLRYCRRYVGDAQCAEDLTQEIFFRVWSARQSYRPQARFATWLYAIASNVCSNELRCRRRQRLRWGVRLDGQDGIDELSGLPAGVPGGEEWVLGREIGAALERALARLPERQRQAFLLGRVDGLATHDTAEIMDCTEGAVRVLVCRATRSLGRELARMLGTAPRS